jgi:hypothetical protein
MAGIHCSRCSSLINTDTSSSSAPPWCPTCGADFAPAAKEGAAPAPAPARPATPAAPAPPPAAPQLSRLVKRLAPPPRRPRVKAPLPAGVPAAVAALGPPDQTHAPDEDQSRRNRLLLRGLVGGVGLVVLALAGFLWWASDNPSPHLPPPDTALGVAIAFAVLGLLSAATSLAPWGERFATPPTFLVYEDALVELRGGRHRIIPWEKVGSQRQVGGLSVTYRFPVQGGKPVAFDDTVRGHKLLCETIRDRAAERRSRVAFGGEAALAAMSAARPGPFFLARRLSGDEGVFRVTVLGDRLLFYKMAYGAGVIAGPAADEPAGLQGWAQAEVRDKFLAEMQVLEESDAATLLYLAAENEESFAVSAEDVREARIDPAPKAKSLLQGLSAPPHEGLLRLTHARRGG